MYDYPAKLRISLSLKQTMCLQSCLLMNIEGRTGQKLTVSLGRRIQEF